MLYISDEDHEAKAPLIRSIDDDSVQSPSPPHIQKGCIVEMNSPEAGGTSHNPLLNEESSTAHDHGGVGFDMSEVEKQPRSRWIVLFTLCLQNIAIWYSFDLLSVLHGEFMHHFRLADWQYYLAYSMTIVPCLLLTMFASKLIERLNGVLHSLLLSLLCTLLAQTLMALSCTIHAPSVVLLICARILYGFGFSLNAISSFMILHCYFDDHIASTLALSFSCVRIGFILNQVVSVYVQQKFHSLPLTVWMTALFILVSLLVAVYSLSATHRGRYRILPISPLKHSLRHYRGLHVHSHDAVVDGNAAYLYSFKIGFWLLLLLCGLGFTFFCSWNVLAESLLQNTSGLDDAVVSDHYSIFFFDVLPTVLGPFYGVLLDYNQAFFSTLVMGGVFGLVGHVLMTTHWQWLPHSPLIALALLCFGATFFNAAIWPSIACMIETNKLCSAYAVIYAFYCVCYTLSNLVMTRQTGHKNVTGYLMFLCLIYCVISILLCLWKKDDEHRVKQMKQYRYRLAVNAPSSNFSLLTIDEQCIDHNINDNNGNDADDEEDQVVMEGDGEHETLMGLSSSELLEYSLAAKNKSDVVDNDNNESSNETMLGGVGERDKIMFLGDVP